MTYALTISVTCTKYMFLEKSDTDIEPRLCFHCLRCCHNKYRFSVLFVKFLSVLLYFSFSFCWYSTIQKFGVGKIFKEVSFFVETVMHFFRFKKEQDLFEIEMFCNIVILIINYFC